MPSHHIHLYSVVEAKNEGNDVERSAMSDAHAPDDHHDPERYEIRLKGHLDVRWADRFDGLSFTHASDGTTILSGPVVDQAALYGLLRRVRDLGLPLIAVLQVEPEPADVPDVSADKGE
jgi:hypothetical protein